MHVSSLPSKFGIGTLGRTAFSFVDFLSEAGLKLWQMLPVCPIDEAGSPYQSFSTFAGNYLFIDLEILANEGLLELSDCEGLNWGFDEAVVDFDAVKQNKSLILHKIFDKWIESGRKVELDNFVKKNSWVESYAVFMALFNHFNKEAWWNWPNEFKTRNDKALKSFVVEHENEVLYYIFEQFIFFQQWNSLKKYANEKGVKLIGDLPIYVAGNSTDVWTNPGNFCLDENLMPKKVAGCPPDAFSADGQLWGNPVYDWAEMEKSGYEWWARRLKSCADMFDIIRIDHFRGFESFYVIDAFEKTARNGKWVKGPGLKFFKEIEKRIGKLNLIAEDLGFLTDETKKLLEQTGFPGMKILQFAFDPREKSAYLPHTYVANSVCYTGTHDNNTAVGWFNEIDETSRSYCRSYLNFEKEPINWVLIRATMASVCNLAIIPVQDFLGLDEASRMNTPGTIKGNWRFKLTLGQQVKLYEMAPKIKEMVELYGR